MQVISLMKLSSQLTSKPQREVARSTSTCSLPSLWTTFIGRLLVYLLLTERPGQGIRNRDRQGFTPQSSLALDGPCYNEKTLGARGGVGDASPTALVMYRVIGTSR